MMSLYFWPITHGGLLLASQVFQEFENSETKSPGRARLPLALETFLQSVVRAYLFINTRLVTCPVITRAHEILNSSFCLLNSWRKISFPGVEENTNETIANTSINVNCQT